MILKEKNILIGAQVFGQAKNYKPLGIKIQIINDLNAKIKDFNTEKKYSFLNGIQFVIILEIKNSENIETKF